MVALEQTSVENATITTNADIVSTNQNITRKIAMKEHMVSVASSVQVHTPLVTPAQTTGLKDKTISLAMESQSSFASILVTGGVVSISQVKESSQTTGLKDETTSPVMESQPSFASALVTVGVISISQVEESSTTSNGKQSLVSLSSEIATQTQPKAFKPTPTSSIVTTQLIDTAVETSIKAIRKNSSSTAMQATPTSFAIKTTVLKMKHSSTLKPTSTAATLKPRYNRTSILTNIPPELKEPMRPVSLTEGKVSQLKIPEETFHDNIDGGTRHLQLHLLSNERKPLPPTSWILLNRTNQNVYALPMETNIGPYKFIVSATDSGNLATVATLQLIVKKDLNRYNHKVTINLKLDNDTFLDHLSTRMVLLQKLAEFFAVNLTNIQVESFGSGTSLTFHFDCVPFRVCDHELLIQLPSTFLDGDAKVTPSFRKILSPQFSVISGYYKMLGPCAKDGDQTAAHTSPTNEDIWWLYAFIPVILLIAILVTSAVYATRGRCAAKKREPSEEEHRLNEVETHL